MLIADDSKLSAIFLQFVQLTTIYSMYDNVHFYCFSYVANLATKSVFLNIVVIVVNEQYWIVTNEVSVS